MADVRVAEPLYQRWRPYATEAPATLTVRAEARPLVRPGEAVTMHPVTCHAAGTDVIHIRFGTLAQAAWETAADRIHCRYDVRWGADTPAQLQWTVECLDTLACWLAAAWLPQRGATLLHASAVLDDRGTANLFSGPSGVGKSTLAATAPQERVLADEVLMLASQEGGQVMTTVPWRSQRWEPAPGTAYPVGRMVFLYRTGQAGAATLSSHAALQHLLYGGLYGRTVRPTDYQHRLSLLAALVERTPCYRLRYAWPDEDPWPQIRALPSARRATRAVRTAAAIPT